MNPFGAVRFEVVPAGGEHQPSYVLAVLTETGGGPLIEINHHADYRVDDARAKWVADACEAKRQAEIGAIDAGDLERAAIALREASGLSPLWGDEAALKGAEAAIRAFLASPTP